MSTENERSRDQMRLFAPGRSFEIDQMIEDTERALRNTAEFLAHIRENEANTRTYIQQFRDRLEHDLEVLQRKREGGGRS